MNMQEIIANLMKIKIRKSKKWSEVLSVKDIEYRDVNDISRMGKPITSSSEMDLSKMEYLILTPVEGFFHEKNMTISQWVYNHSAIKDVVHVTSVGGCLRPRQLAKEGKKPLPYSHSVSARGTMVHEACEKLNKQIIERGHYYYNPDELFVYDNLLNDRNKARIPEWMFNELVPTVIEQVEKLSDWIHNNPQHYDDTVGKVQVEKTMYFLVSVANSHLISDMHPVAFLTGTPDMYNNKTLFDFKSGIRHMEGHSRQIRFYNLLLSCIDSKVRDMILVYLGKSKVTNMNTHVSNLARGDISTGVMFGDLFNHIKNCKIVDETKHADAEYGFHCTFCGFRNNCYGI